MKIKEYQSGGIIYTPFISSRGATASSDISSSASTSSKKSSDSDKESNLIQKEIINVLKENGLENDVNDFLTKANSILKSAQQLSSTTLFGGVEESYSMSHLISVLQLANEVKQNKGRYDDAVANLKTEKAGGEVALSSNGDIYVITTDSEDNYDFTTVSPTEYYKNKEKYQALTNSQVLQLRRSDSSLIYRTDILGDVSEAISMKTVTDQLNDTISKFKSIDREEYIKNTGEKIPQSVWDGMQILIGEGPEGYYKVTTKSQKDNLDKAFLYLWRTLGDDGQKKLMAESAVQGFDPTKHYGDIIASALELQTAYSFDVNFDSAGTKSAGIGEDNGEEGKYTADPRVARIARADGIPQQVTIAPRVKDPITKEIGLTTTGYNFGSFTDKDGNKITEVMSLRTIMGEDPIFGAAVDLKHISFGNTEINPRDLDTIIVDPNYNNLSGVWMPYKETGAGYVIDFSMVGKYKEMEEILKNSSDLSQMEIMQKMRDKGIDPNKLRWEVENGKIRYWLDTKYFLTFSAFGNDDLMNGLDDNEFFERIGEEGGTWKGKDARAKIKTSLFNDVMEYGRQKHGDNATKVYERSFWNNDDWDYDNAYWGNVFIAIDPEQASYFIDDQLVDKHTKTKQVQRIQVNRNQQNSPALAPLPEE